MRKLYTILLLALIYAFLNVLLYNSHTYNIQRQKEHTELIQELQRQREQLQDAELFYKQARELMDKLSITEMEATAYAPLDPDAVEGMCYSGDPRVTATGARTTPGRTIATDPAVIPMGTRVYIPGVGVRVAEDRGDLIRGNRLDLCMSSRSAALEWGIRGVTAAWVEG